MDSYLEFSEIQKVSLAGIRQRVRMIVTNFVQKLWSQTQGEYLQGMPPEEVRYEWQTVGDDRTCPICEPNEGKMFDSMASVMAEYPPHPNCRCWINVKKIIQTRPGSRFQWTPPEGW